MASSRGCSHWRVSSEPSRVVECEAEAEPVAQAGAAGKAPCRRPASQSRPSVPLSVGRGAVSPATPGLAQHHPPLGLPGG